VFQSLTKNTTGLTYSSVTLHQLSEPVISL